MRIRSCQEVDDRRKLFGTVSYTKVLVVAFKSWPADRSATLLRSKSRENQKIVLTCISLLCFYSRGCINQTGGSDVERKVRAENRSCHLASGPQSITILFVFFFLHNKRTSRDAKYLLHQSWLSSSSFPYLASLVFLRNRRFCRNLFRPSIIFFIFE